MILLDANLLVYAHVADFAEHDAARAWLDEQLNTLPKVAIPWPSALAFVRLTTNPRVFDRPLTMARAWRQLEAWLDVPSTWVPTPTARHRAILSDLVKGAVTRSNLVPDAHLAALAIEHGLTLCSTDGDFARFEDLSWKNPLAG